VLFPASGSEYFERLRYASVFHDRIDVRPLGVDRDGPVVTDPALTLSAVRLDHRPETFGWRIEEPDGRHLLVDRLEAAGIHGPAVGQLQRTGWVETERGRARLEDLSVRRPGQRVAFVMDTGICDAAVSLAEGADLLVCESTFADEEVDLARKWNHLTASDAARTARDSGARQLVLSHFSQRYPDTGKLVEQAAAIFPDVLAAEDLLRVPVPARSRPEPTG
jgi:ribonuclease Z